MSDLAAFADTNCVNGQGDKDISQKNYIEKGEEHQYGDMWCLSQDGGLLKNHSGDDSIETSDRCQKSFIKKSSIFKEFVEATSPILSPLLSQVKQKHPSDKISFSEASVKQLVSQTNCDNKDITSPEKSVDDKTHTSAKQKSSPGELNKRKKTKNDDEKKNPKQIKEEANRSAKGACPQCGMSNIDGLRIVCKSCINLRRESKSKEALNLKKKRIKAPTVTDSENKSETPPASEIEQNDEVIYTEGECQSKNRSMSLDLNDIVDTSTFSSKKYCPPKRTSTDLGQASKVDIMYDGSPHAKQSIGKMGDPGDNQGLNHIGFTAGDFTLGQKRDGKQSSQQMKMDGKHRLMKRSTTDSEIVNKVKINVRKSSDESKALNGHKKPDSIKTQNEKREHSGASGRSESPESGKEHSSVSYKLERSKTILGKVNFEPEKKISTEGTEGIKTKELSSNSLDNERLDLKSKKLFNSVRSHTIIGDGLAKRQKQKPESTKVKSSKREGSSNSVKKKHESKHLGDAEDEKKVSFADEECIKKRGQDDEPKPINNTIPKTLYDCNPEEYSSDSESESEIEIKDDESELELVPAEPTVIKSSSNHQQKTNYDPVTKHKSQVQENNMRWIKMENDYGTTNIELASRYDNYQLERINYGIQNQIEDGLAFHPAYETDDDDNDGYNFNQDKFKVNETNSQSYATYSTDNEQEYNALEKIDEEIEEIRDEDAVYQPTTENWYYTEVANVISVSNSDHNVRDIVKNDSYFERCNSIDQEANHEEIEHSYSDYHPYPISRSGKEVGVPDECTSWTGKENMPDYRETSLIETGSRLSSSGRDINRDYFGYETDVDTGLPVNHKIPEDGYTIATINEWGFLNADSDSSSSSGGSDDEDDDAWYTGGLYATKSKSNTSQKNDDLIYFNDNAGAQMSDSDIYTGELFSKIDSKVYEIKDISKNNNISLEENILERRKIWYNISSRPQMHPASTKTVVNTGVNAQSANDGIFLSFCNLSNNGSHDEEAGYISPQDTRNEGRKIKQMVFTRSDYTEYANVVNHVKPKEDLILFGNTDFTKYDSPKYEVKPRDEDAFVRRGESDKVFFGESQKQISKPLVTTCEKNLYFNTKIPENTNYEHHYDQEQERKLDRDDSYQGGFFYASRYGCNNNNGPDDDYTGCFRNEEEYKPTFEGLFNDKPTSFNFQKRRPDIDTMYFASSNSKSYYDIEDSIYAFEQRERAIKNKKPEKPPIVKVGGITVRNNVECEVDYAQNINMDLQMTTWKRYDAVGEDEAPETEGSNYAKNILFEEMVGGKPWVMDDCRAPWKVPKPQSNIPGKNKNDTKWKAPDKVVKSVKSLGTYVTKWF